MKNKLLNIIFIIAIICSFFLSNEILEALSYTESTYTNAGSMANDYFVSLNDNEKYLTSGPNLCALVSNRIKCSGEENISLISKVEFDMVKGNYLFNAMADPYWLNDTLIEFRYEATISGVKEKSSEEVSGVKPAVYIKEETKLIGSGTWQDPFILQGPSIIPKYTLTVELNGGTSNQIFDDEYVEGYPIPLTTPEKTGCNFTNWTKTGNGTLSASGDHFIMGNTDVTLSANYDCTYILTMDLNGGTGTNQSGSYEQGTKIVLTNPTKNSCNNASSCSCTFANWTKTGGGTLNATQTELIMGNSSTTLTANYNCSYLFPYVTKQRTTGAPGTETPSYTFTVPSTAKYKIELWGARGGMLLDNNVSVFGVAHYNYGGAYTEGEIELTAGDVLYIYVGGRGCDTYNDTGCANQIGAACSVSEFLLLGGYNGGGNGHYGGCGGSNYPWGGGYPGGGGATDIRYGNTSLDNRIMVAGGGGGANSSSININAAAGGLTNNDSGAFQTSGNSKGYGQQGYGGKLYCSSSSSCYWGSYPAPGSGGGYWGALQNGRGGSSYISGHTGCIAVNSSGSSKCSETKVKASSYVGTTDRNCSINFTGKSFIDGTTVMIDGAGYSWSNKRDSQVQMDKPNGTKYAIGIGHNDNGYAKITQLDS